MATLKLTTTKIERYRLSKSDEMLLDGNGLYIRLRRGHAGDLTRTWLYTYKEGPRSIYLTLGEYNEALDDFNISMYHLSPNSRLTLEVARRIATEIKDWRRRGLKPKQQIEAASRGATSLAEERARSDEAFNASLQQDNLTVRDLFGVWIADGVRRKDGNAALKRLFEADILPTIGAIPIKLLTENEIRSVLRAQVDRGINRTAVITRNTLTQMFTWGRKRQPWRRLMIEGNPMELIEIEKIVSPAYDMSNQSDRVLSIEEIRELWIALRRAEDEYACAPNRRLFPQPLEKKAQCAIWIMLSTLCRIGELTMARWEHIDFSKAEWFIPKENVKGNVAHLLVYLSPFSLDQFRILHANTGHSDWCFPNRPAEMHMDLKAITKQISDRQTMFKKAKLPGSHAAQAHRRYDDRLVLATGKNGPWSPHDLRRTGATLMQALGTSLDIIDRCQNHIIFGSKVRRVYLRHDYALEKRDAWQKLGDKLTLILSEASELYLRIKHSNGLPTTRAITSGKKK